MDVLAYNVGDCADIKFAMHAVSSLIVHLAKEEGREQGKSSHALSKYKSQQEYFKFRKTFGCVRPFHLVSLLQGLYLSSHLLMTCPHDGITVFMLECAIAHLILILEIRLELPVEAFGVTGHFESVSGCIVVDINLGDSVGGCGIDLELDVAGAFHESVEKGGFVNGTSNRLYCVSRW